MDVPSIYALRPSVKQPLPDSVVEIFSKLRTSFRPVFRKPHRREPPAEPANWRQNVLVETLRKVREKDDADYDEINAAIDASHPMEPGEAGVMDADALAMHLVGARYEKRELVNLVRWLLIGAPNQTITGDRK